MSRVYLIIFLGIYLSCSSPGVVVGTWTTNQYSLWERGIAYLKGSRGMMKGKEVILNSDSTYIESYHGLIRTGKWCVVNDSLYMKANDSNNQPEDSIDTSLKVTHVSNSKESYEIKRHKLIKYHSGNYCKRRRKDGSIDYKNNFIVEILKRKE